MCLAVTATDVANGDAWYQRERVPSLDMLIGLSSHGLATQSFFNVGVLAVVSRGPSPA